MKMRFFSCCLFFILLFSTPVKPFGLHDVLDIVGVAKDIVVWIAKAWNVIEGQVEFSEVPFPLLDKTERKLFNKMDMINTRLNELSARVEAIGKFNFKDLWLLFIIPFRNQYNIDDVK